MDIIFQKVSSPKCIKQMELNFQFAGVTDHIFSHELSKWLNLFVLLFLYKKGDFSNYKDANVKVDVDIFYAHVNIVHIVDVDIAHHENEQLILLMMMMAILRLFFALKRELLNYLRLSEISGFHKITFTFYHSFIWVRNHHFHFLISFSNMFPSQSCECSRRDGGAWLEIWRRQRHLQHNTLWGWFSLTLFGGGVHCAPLPPPPGKTYLKKT